MITNNTRPHTYNAQAANGIQMTWTEEVPNFDEIASNIREWCFDNLKHDYQIISDEFSGEVIVTDRLDAALLKLMFADDLVLVESCKVVPIRS